jgi:hypothetical protein
MTVWRPLLDHAVLHLDAGKLISTEADAFFLPDTQGTDYRTQHTKTTIVIADLDVDRRRLGYFHNAGYYALDGEDFDHLFRRGVPPDPTYMPLYAELIRMDRVKRLSPAELRTRSKALLADHLRRRPLRNPIPLFASRLEQDIPLLQAAGLAAYHVYAFATVRQLGAAFELAGLYLRWLGPPGNDQWTAAADAFLNISAAAKTLILKAARAVNAKRPADFGPLLSAAAVEWERGFSLVDKII